MGASLIPKPPGADRGWLNLRKMEAGGQPCCCVLGIYGAGNPMPSFL